MKRGVQGIETAAIDQARDLKSYLDTLPEGDARRPFIEREIRDLGILHNRLQLDRVKEEYENDR